MYQLQGSLGRIRSWQPPMHNPVARRRGSCREPAGSLEVDVAEVEDRLVAMMDVTCTVMGVAMKGIQLSACS